MIGRWRFTSLALKTSGAVQAARWADALDGGLYLFLQRPAFAVHRHDAKPADSGRCPSARPCTDGRERPEDFAAGPADRPRHDDRRSSTSTTANGRDGYDQPPSCAAERLTKRSSIATTGDFAARIRSRDIRRSARGRAVWRGRSWDSPKSWNFCAGPARLHSDANDLDVSSEAATATADFYLDQASAADGIPYWDTGAPNLHRLGDWQSRDAEPFNEHEPVDSSAAAIAAQGLLRLGKYLGDAGARYFAAGLDRRQNAVWRRRTLLNRRNTRA